MSERPRRSEKWTAILMGIILGTAAASQLLDFEAPPGWLLVGFLVLWLAGFGLADLCLHTDGFNSWPQHSLKGRLAGMGGCLLAGFFLILVIPITVYPKPQEVRILATGEQNPLSKGSEVWLTGIFAGNYDSPNQLRSCKGDWFQVNNALVSYKDRQPSTLVCTVRADEDFTVQIGTHAWSGRVQVESAGSTLEADLYSDPSGRKLFTYQVNLGGMDRALWYVFFIAIGLSFAWLLLCISLSLIHLPSSERVSSAKPIPWYGYATWMAMVWLLYLLVYWPGFFSPDTLNQFTQIATGEYTAWHPIFHTLFLWLMTRLGFSPAPAVILQILTTSCLLGWGFSMLESRGVPRGITLASALFLSVSPGVSLILLNPWKDVAYSIAVLALSLTFFYLLIRGDQNGISLPLGALLVVITACVALFRHNGPPAAFGSLLIMMLVDRGRWKPYLRVLLATILVWLAVRGPLADLILTKDEGAVENNETLQVMSEALYLAYYHDRSGTEFLPEEKRLLEGLIDENGAPRLEKLREASSSVVRLAGLGTLRRPGVTARFVIRESTFVLQILVPPNDRFSYVTFYDGEGMVENPFGILPDSKLPALKPYFNKLKDFFERPALDWLFWRNAFWMYVLILSGVTASIRLKKVAVLGVIAPVLLNALPFILVGAQRARYLYPTLLLGPLLGIGLMFVRKMQADPDPVAEIDESE